MSPDDETRVPPTGDGDRDAGPPAGASGPATWAGRQRAAGSDAAERSQEPAEPDGDENADESAAADLGGDEAGAADEAPEPEAQPTVEAETLTVADREAAREAALAGVRARTGAHAVAADLDQQAQPDATQPQDEAAGAEPREPEPEPEPQPEPDLEPAAAMSGDDGGRRPGAKRLWARFLAASLTVVFSIAAATSISLLVFFTEFADKLGHNNAFASLRDQLEEADGGAPQTILILGSDKRQDTRGDPGRSDTTILLRVDPDKDAIALLSIPRDLKVYIPGLGQAKFNEAYTEGGADLTLRVVKQLTDLRINHVVNINFNGFADAVNAIEGVYVDVDRQYYVPEGSGYAAIDPPIDAGYQLMKGLKALQYVRYRHNDNDLVRSARQQDFLREARQKLPPEVLINDRTELLRIFTQYTTSDISDAVALLELLKTFAGVQSAPVREVHFPADLGDGTSGYVTASDEGIKQAVDQFLNTAGTPGERPAGEPDASGPKPNGGGGKGGKGHEKPSDDHFQGPAMDDSTAIAQQFAGALAQAKRKDGDPMIEFPIYYPTRVAPGSTIDDYSRAFVIDGPENQVYHGYKLVVQFPGPAGFPEYYGFSGTDWADAPILDNPSETRTIDGREYELFYDGDRLRLVGWKTRDAGYWVSNSLLQALDEGEMLSIVTSARELGH